MKLKKLLSEVPLEIYKGNKDVDITGITLHSKKVFPGNLFIAKKGFSDDGSKYIEEAVSSGAVAILSDMKNPFLKEVVQLIHPNIREVEGKLAACFYHYPCRKLLMMAVTGTNGKTTIAYLLKSLFDSLGKKTGLLGTIEYIRGDKKTAADRTTPDVISNHKFLREMISEGCEAAALEVTSHALDQGRVSEIDFDVAIYTNLSRDHIDEYHLTMENYAAAKAKLFSSLAKDKVAIVNADCPWHKTMIENCGAKIITYGLSPSANLFADQIQLSQAHTTFQLHFEGKSYNIKTPLIGRHNVSNLLACLACGMTQNISLDRLAELIPSLTAAKGRLERVSSSNVFIDYAHTPDALEKVLLALYELKKGKIITCFGCGGNRDHAKRPLMASVAEKFSDHVIVTSDNPRKEEPLAIIEEIRSGFEKKSYEIEADRARAIEKAIRLAKKEDIVLIAGKGHETVQIVGNLSLPFDDKEVASAVLRSHPCE